LQVNRFSAYDMLKALERKGLATPQYVLRQHGPGRSAVLFSPTPQAFSQLGEVATEEWQETKKAILARLREAVRAGGEGYRELAAEISALLPETTNPLTYCANMVAASLLSLRGMPGRLAELGPIRGLLDSATSARQGLSALAGLSLGTYLFGGRDPSPKEEFLAQLNRFQSYLASLSEESLERLAELMREGIALCDTHS
ncbi:MAG TPA: hypothetical protein VJ565_02175, partial [Dehalococcoidia bacterium]|nr:hypothetical protein [Dehalococcoidia bacterium]